MDCSGFHRCFVLIQPDLPCLPIGWSLSFTANVLVDVVAFTCTFVLLAFYVPHVFLAFGFSSMALFRMK